MGQIYTAPIAEASYSTAISIIQIAAPADAVVVLLEAHIGFDTIISAAEAIEFKRTSTVGTGTAVTEVRNELGFAAPGASCLQELSAEGSLVDTLFEMSFNVLNGFHYIPIPEARLVISPSDFLNIGFGTAPTAITLNGYITWEEIGG